MSGCPISAMVALCEATPVVFLGGLFVLGLMVGSFANVMALRLLADESFVHPPSHCTHCQARIRPWDNIPVLSWLLLGGRCRACKATISIQYPLVELATGLLFAGVGWLFGLTWALPFWLFFAFQLVVITLTDWRESLIFELNSLPLIPVGFVLCLLGLGPTDWQGSLLGIAAAAAFFEGMIFLSRKAFGTDGFGHGDTHLMMGVGAFVGWPLVGWAIAAGFVLQAILAIPMLAVSWVQHKQYRLLGSGASGMVFAALPWALTPLIPSPDLLSVLTLLCAGLALVAMFFFLRAVRESESYTYLPLGPALVLGSLVVLVLHGRLPLL